MVGFQHGHEIFLFFHLFKLAVGTIELPIQWYRQRVPQNDKAGARSWSHSGHLPHCRASEWVNIHLHSPYVFVPCKGAALCLPCIILAVFTDLKFLRPMFHYLPSSYHCVFLYLFHSPASFCLLYYRHIIFFCSLCFSLFFPFFFLL